MRISIVDFLYPNLSFLCLETVSICCISLILCFLSMRLALSNSWCNRVQFVRLTLARHSRQRNRWAHMGCNPNRPKQKILVIMGATGTGKSRLSIDIASRFPSEIINIDKIQLYRGLDITTNKIPMPDRRGVPHHLLGDFDPDSEVSAADYRSIAGATIDNILMRRQLPIVVGGSNSFIHALVSDRYETGLPNNGFGLGPAEFRYNCCFIWVDLARHVLDEYLSLRVDEMLDSGMFEELADFYNSGHYVGPCNVGLKKAIGVPEFERYFRRFGGSGRHEMDAARRLAYEEAVQAIKNNTYELVDKQVEKILRLRSSGWALHRMNASDSFRAVLSSDTARYRDAWEKDVLQPSVKIVKQFLDGVCYLGPDAQ